jgi:peptide/nickel transport system permease protein
MSDGVVRGGAVANGSGTADLAPQLDAATVGWINITPGRRLRSGTLRLGRALRDPAVAIPAAILVLLILACFAGPALLGVPSPTVGNLQQYLLPLGSPGHLLGTNQLGNDMLSRMLYGGRVSIELLSSWASAGCGLI